MHVDEAEVGVVLVAGKPAENAGDAPAGVIAIAVRVELLRMDDVAPVVGDDFDGAEEVRVEVLGPLIGEGAVGFGAGSARDLDWQSVNRKLRLDALAAEQAERRAVVMEKARAIRARRQDA